MASYVIVAALLAFGGCCLLTAQTVVAECVLSIGTNGPLVVKTLGTRRVQLRRNLNSLRLSNGETVTTHCNQGTKLHLRQYYGDGHESNFPKSLTWYCINNLLRTDISEIDLKLENNDIESIGCKSPEDQRVYVSNVSLEDCVEGTTILIGTNSEDTNVKSLALCYDVSRLMVRYISYIAYPPRNVLDKKVYVGNELEALSFDEILYDFKNYFNFMSLLQFDDAKKTASKNLPAAIYNERDFVLASLLQDEPLVAELADFEVMLNIVWLEQLLHGNWKQFLQALRMRSDVVSYAVRLGTSDAIALPMLTECNKTQDLVFSVGEGPGTKVPKYVWAHLRSLQTPGANQTAGDMEDFVVVALNTPYLELSPAHTLCTDICETIPWLGANFFNKLHLIPHYGVVLCCRTADVAHKLSGFPVSSSTLRTAQPATTEQPPTKWASQTSYAFAYSNENTVGSGEGSNEYEWE